VWLQHQPWTKTNAGSPALLDVMQPRAVARQFGHRHAKIPSKPCGYRGRIACRLAQAPPAPALVRHDSDPRGYATGSLRCPLHSCATRAEAADSLLGLFTVVIVRTNALNLDVSFAAGQSERNDSAVPAGRP
jgi:hypothetical protein